MGKMKNKLVSISLIMILLPVMITSAFISKCDANYANWGIFDEGSSLHNGTFISMPFADVQINITRMTNFAIVTMYSEFHIHTNRTQNTTLAFVYPHTSK